MWLMQIIAGLSTALASIVLELKNLEQNNHSKSKLLVTAFFHTVCFVFVTMKSKIWQNKPHDVL